MRKAFSRIQILCLSLCAVVCGSSCLPEAVAPASRKNITIDGIGMPLGIYLLNWASAEVSATVFKILVNERLGINAIFSGVGETSASGNLALAGCERPGSAYDKEQRCGLPGSRHHVSLELWTLTSNPMYIFLQENYAFAVGTNLGSIGYAGKEGIFLPRQAANTARSAEGLRLEYFAAYDADWWNAAKYFTRPSDIPLELLKFCNETQMWNSAALGKYIQVSRDKDGVVLNPDGSGSAVCDSSGRWWRSPACRAQPSLCIPLVNAGPGWSIETLIQQVTAWNMPVSMAVARNLSLWAAIPRQGNGTLFYSWSPDTTFLDIDPVTLILPPYDPTEWAVGNWRTDFVTTTLAKLVSNKLDRAAPGVVQLATAFSLPTQVLAGLLAQATSAAATSTEDVVCQWLKANRKLWEDWIPRPTSCRVDSGQGLVDASGAFVFNESLANSCSRCAPGRFATLKPGQRAAICDVCAAGSFSNAFGATECLLCLPGTMAPPVDNSSRLLNTECLVCPKGTFQPNASSASCVPCSTVILNSTSDSASRSPSACVCPPGSYLLQEPNAPLPRCAACSAGLLCPGGPDLPLQAEGSFARSWSLNPNQVLTAAPQTVSCQPFRCPEGLLLGKCPDRMEGLACATCQPGYMMYKNQCHVCTNTPGLPQAVAAFLLLMFTASLCFLVTRAKGSLLREESALLLLIFNLEARDFQILLAFSTNEFPWVEPLKSVKEIVTLVLVYFGPSCMFQANHPVAQYLFQVCAALAVGIVLLLGLLITSRCFKRLTRARIVSTLGMVIWSCHLSLGLAAVRPWQGTLNADGSITMSYRRDVTFFSTDHVVMVGISSVAILVYICVPTAVVVWATLKFPSMIVRPGGIQFISYFDFLFMNFAPERYYAVLIFCFSANLLVILPVLLQLFPLVMATSMISTVVLTTSLVARHMPFRLEVVNTVYLIKRQMIIAILVACLGLSQVDDPAISVFLVAVLAVTFLQLVFLGIWLLVKHVQARAPFEVFLCHHKVGAGVLARWMKMELVQHLQGQVFLDSDNLNRLDSIFDVVANRTKNLVVILTRETLKRVWCAAEITCAVQNKVNIIPLVCDDFPWPIPEEFLESLGDLWMDHEIAIFTTLGVDVGQIREAYEELSAIPPLRLDRASGIAQQLETVMDILTISKGGSLSSQAKGLRSPKEMLRPGLTIMKSHSESMPTVLLVGDSVSPEATVLRAVLRRLIQQRMHVDVRCHEVGSALPSDIPSLVLVLSKDVLKDPHFACTLVASDALGASHRQGPKWLPVIADSAFQVPDTKFWDELLDGKVIAPDLLGDVALEALCAAYKKLFKTVSASLTPHGSETLLLSEVEIIANRLEECEWTGPSVTKAATMHVNNSKKVRAPPDPDPPIELSL